MKKLLFILLFPSAVFGQQYLRPDADNTVNSWTTTTLFSKVNEVTADDATSFIRNANGSTAQVELRLSDPTGGTNVKGLRTLFARALASGSGGAEQLTIYLYQGATQIAASSATSISRSTWTDITIILSAAQEANITDYTDLRIRMAMTTGGASEFIEVTQCYFYLPISTTLLTENLFTYSEEINNEFTTQNLITGITTDATTDPNSTTTADLVIPNATSSNSHYIRSAWNGTANQDYTFSVYAKAGTYSGLKLVGATGSGGVFDLSNGTTSSLNATITSVGSGWYRCSYSYYVFTGGVFLVAEIDLFNTPTNATNSTAYSGNGTDGIYLWGAMIQRGTDATSGTPSTYIKVPAGGSTNKPKFFIAQ